MARQRLGVALLIPPPVGTEIDALRKALGDDDIDRVGPHLTLVPPVNVRDDEVDAAVAALHTAAGATPPLRLVLGPVATFAPVSDTLHLAIGGDVERLHALRDAVFVPPLERPLSNPFVPHVTLIERTARIEEGLAVLAGYQAEVVLDRVHLLREERTDEGRRTWRPIAESVLGAKTAVVGRGGLELELTPTGKLPPDADRWIHERWDDFEVERFGEVLPRDVPIGIVARRDGRIVGAAQGEVRTTTGEAYLANLIVAADLRGGGIGAHIVAAFGSLAAEHGATFLTLRTEAGGRSQPFYERLGFTELYRMPAWRNGRDFVQLRREL